MNGDNIHKAYHLSAAASALESASCSASKTFIDVFEGHLNLLFWVFEGLDVKYKTFKFYNTNLELHCQFLQIGTVVPMPKWPIGLLAFPICMVRHLSALKIGLYQLSHRLVSISLKS